MRHSSPEPSGVKQQLLGMLLIGLTWPAQAKPVDIDQLLSKMTLSEKLGQIQQFPAIGDPTGPGATASLAHQYRLIREGRVGSILNAIGAHVTNEMQKLAVEESRLHIPILFGYDVIHGHRTVFPCPLGETASWDPPALEESAALAASEAYASGVRWVFAPMVDIARDARWGRVVEGAGEDPYLGSAAAAARVRGFQRNGRVAACAKHWVAYGRAEAGRDYNTVDVSERTLREVYLPPFKACVDAGVQTFMSAFNEINGVPATANRFILTDILRGEWRFAGFVVSDWSAVDELLNHGIAADGKEAARVSLTAGVDMEMSTTHINDNAAQLLKTGQIKAADIDAAVRRILSVKQQMGLFDHPYVDEKVEQSVLLAPRHRAYARQSAARSMVLLKNQGGVLPFPKSVKTVAVIGPLGDSGEDIIGPWHGDGRGNEAVTVVAGVRNKLPAAQILAVEGCDIRGKRPLDESGINRALAAADVVIVAVGEGADMSGEAASRSKLDLTGQQMELIRMVHESGKPYVVTLLNGRPLTLGWAADHSPAILEAWFPGSEGGNAIADVLFGDVNPAGKLPISFPRTVGQCPIYYNYKNTGRPAYLRDTYVSNYLDVAVDPQYCFGYGLSYTTFGFSDLSLSAPTIPPDGKITVHASVANTGKRAGDEVVQLYIRDKVSSVTRPVRELKGFRRISLQPGEKKTVSFELGPKELGFFDLGMHWVVEPGVFEVYVGGSSKATLNTSFTVR